MYYLLSYYLRYNQISFIVSFDYSCTPPTIRFPACFMSISSLRVTHVSIPLSRNQLKAFITSVGTVLFSMALSSTRYPHSLWFNAAQARCSNFLVIEKSFITAGENADTYNIENTDLVAEHYKLNVTRI